MPQLPFARVAPSPGGASVASSGTHEDIDNIGSPGWPGTPVSGMFKSCRLYFKLVIDIFFFHTGSCCLVNCTALR